MKVVFLGPPGAGKGTQSRTITERHGIPQVSTGELIRAHALADDELGDDLRAVTHSGELVPDEMMNGMVKKVLGEARCYDGFLLDGYPRTLNQAQALDEMLAAQGHGLDHVLFLDAPDRLLLERVTGRRTDPDTGRTYHLVYDPPPAEVVHRLIQRDDDTAAVFGARIRTYREKTAPLIPYYQNKGILRRIDGQGTMIDVRDRIDDALVGRRQQLQSGGAM